MAIFHASVRTISRATGRSATAAAAYRSGTSITDVRSGLTHDYTRKGGVVGSAIVLPAGAGEAFRERSFLWNAAEASEKRKDARVARELILALPHELDEAGRAATALSMAEWLAARYGVAVDVSRHKPDRMGDGRNHHAHLLFTTRAITAEGFGEKTKILDDWKRGPEEVLAIRQAWEAIANAALKAAGCDARIDHRSHEDLGIELPPQIHVGVRAKAMARRGAEIPSSLVHVDFRGREVNYPAIDAGATREEYNAEIISLQKYKDVIQEQKEQAEEESIEDKIEALQERAGEISGDIAMLQAVLSSTHLSDDMRGRIRALLEKVIATIFYRQQYEEQIHQQKVLIQKQEKELEEKKKEHQFIKQQIEALQDEQRIEQVRVAAARELFSKIVLMPATLNGVPPYTIRMEMPLSASFNAVSYQASLKQQSNADLLDAVLSRPVMPDRPSMATVTLRQDVLQVKELLSRRRNTPVRETAQAQRVPIRAGMRK